MKYLYRSEDGKIYETEEACQKADETYAEAVKKKAEEKAKREAELANERAKQEAIIAERKAKQKALEEARPARAKELDAAFNKIIEAKNDYEKLYAAFINDYGFYHQTYTLENSPLDIFPFFKGFFKF